MKAVFISDSEFRSNLLEVLEQRLRVYLETRAFEIEEIKIGRDDLTFCKGCFGCWVKKPGECVINDAAGRINHTVMNSDAVFYLSPVVFGQFSANIKNAVDRYLPNMLPFFITRDDGSTMHPPRYTDYPKQIMVGYADELTAEDGMLFTDITRKHRRNVEVILFDHAASELERMLDGMELKRVEGSL